MIPKLSSVLAELVYELAKAAKEESFQESSSSLSVRIKTYQSASSDGQQLLCHLKVSSGWRFPVTELLTEQKLSELARFLLHVQRESEDCHCVLVKTEPASTSPDTRERALTSSVSLTVTQEPKDEEDPCPCGQSHGSEFPTEAGLWERGDSCGGQAREGSEGKSCGRCCRRRKTVVTSAPLGEASRDAEKEGAHLHIRFSAKKLYILEEGKVIHDYLHHLKLFHPTMKLSFVLNIDELTTRASYRFQGMAAIQGQSVITDPKYFSRKSSLSSESFWGCGEKVVLRGPGRSARALCLACHVTDCQPLWPAAAGPHGQGLLSIHVYGPHGVPSLRTDTAGLLDTLATEVSWQQFGLKFTPASSSSSCDKEGKRGQARIALMKERCPLPAWAGDRSFVLSLHLLCSPLDHTPGDHFQEAEQLVEDVLKRKTGADSGGDGGGGDGGGGGAVCPVIAAALMDLYQHPTSDSLQQQQTCSGSHLDRLLPLISKSVAEMYSRSHNQHFRDCMQLMTQVDSGQMMESTLRKDLYALMTSPVPRGAQCTARQPLAAAQQVVTETASPQQSSSAQLSPCRLLTPGFSAAKAQDVRNQGCNRKYDGALSATVEKQVEAPWVETQVMDSQAAEIVDMTSVEEEDWFSQMEQELTL